MKALFIATRSEWWCKLGIQSAWCVCSDSSSQLVPQFNLSIKSEIKRCLKHFTVFGNMQECSHVYYGPRKSLDILITMTILLCFCFLFCFCCIFWMKVKVLSSLTDINTTLWEGPREKIFDNNIISLTCWFYFVKASYLTVIYMLIWSQVWQDSVSEGNPGQDNQQM